MKFTSTQAITATLQGDWSGAIDMNKSILKENPQDVEALNRIALAYMITGKQKAAKSAYQKVLEIDPLNSIAIKNLNKIKNDSGKDGEAPVLTVNNIFLEENGKTKVVDLVNCAQSEVLLGLRTGQAVDLSVKRLKIFISQGKKYIGVLPDDIGKRLIKLINGGNKYEVFVKSSNNQSATIFIREIKRANKFKDQPSFILTAETKLSLGKNGKAYMSEDSEDSEA
jgi:tetratricopeptide (TPR) repeat protein